MLRISAAALGVTQTTFPFDLSLKCKCMCALLDIQYILNVLNHLYFMEYRMTEVSGVSLYEV